MPVQPPNYGIPTFPPTGNPETDKALGDWAMQFGSQYQQGQEAIQRLPAIFTTQTNESTNNPKGNYLSLRVPLQGGEQVVVVGYFDFTVTAGGVLTTNGASYNQQARGKLQVTYPSGSTSGFGAGQEANLRVNVSGQGTSEGVVARTSVTERANVSFTWPIEARFQNGGEHTFTLRTTGSGTVNSAQLTVQVF